MKTVKLSLYDYIAVNRNWEQLWADDDVAYWFNAIKHDEHTPDYEKPYKYQVIESYPYKDYITTNRKFYCKDLSEAFDTWNRLINEYTGSK